MSDRPPGPDEPTAVYRPFPEGGPPTQAMPPTEALPPTGPPPPPPPGVIRDRGPGGPFGPRDNPWVIALLALLALLAIAIIVLLVVGRGHSKSTSPTTSVSTPPTSAPAPTSSTVPVTLPPLPSTVPTTSPPTTVAAPGNRAPTAAEQQQINNAVGPGSPNATPNGQIDQIRIANSDPSWALIHTSPTPGHEQDVQAFYSILHLSNGAWTKVSSGTAQVSCSPNIPTNIVADFADILGTCGSGQ